MAGGRCAIIDHKEAEGIMMRRLIVVDGPLAWRMRRFQAAQANEVGLEVLTLPLLASRLAGGFDIVRQDPPLGVSPQAAAAAIAEVLDSIGDTCPECPPEAG
jgi:hypothetical protein